MQIWIWLLSLAWFLTTADAAQVLKVDRGQKMMAVNHNAKPWSIDEYVCAFREEREVACGHVTRVTRKGALVKFDFWSGSEVATGDLVRSKSDRETAQTDLPALRDPAPAPAPKKITKTAPLPSGPAGELDTLSALKAVEKGVPASEITAPPAPPPPAPTSAPASDPVAAEKPSAPAPKAEESVNLDSLDGSTVSSGDPVQTSPAGETKAKMQSPHASRNSGKPLFKALFDLLLTYRPGIDPPLTFDNYHSLLMLEINPTKDLSFSFEVNPTPRFYELDYRLARPVLLRVGRIYIPFDDLSPHSFFGGRANVSKLTPTGASQFLPDLWTDLGVGLRVNLLEKKRTNVTLDLYVVNGFTEGGNDPVTSGGSYPNFQGGTGLADNNSDKSFGARLSGNFFRNKLGLGVSVYRGRYTDESKPAAGLLIVGTDAQVRLGKTELRAGYAFMQVQLPNDNDGFLRGGLYGEVGYKFAKNWKILLRGGEAQNDNRVVSATDMIIAGGVLLFHAGPLQLSLEHSQDFNPTPDKKNYSYSALRAVMAF